MARQPPMWRAWLLRVSSHSPPSPSSLGTVEVLLVVAPSLCWAGTPRPCSLGGPCEPGHQPVWGKGDTCKSLRQDEYFLWAQALGPPYLEALGCPSPFASAKSLVGTEISPPPALPGTWTRLRLSVGPASALPKVAQVTAGGMGGLHATQLCVRPRPLLLHQLSIPSCAHEPDLAPLIPCPESVAPPH